MGKAIIMKTTGIVTVNGKNVKSGKILVDGDVVKTGPESFTAWIYTEDRTTLKMKENQTWSFMDKTNAEMRDEIEEEYGGTVPGSQLMASARRGRAEADAQGFVIKTPTGVAGVKG